MKIMNGLDLQSQKITALADPSASTDAANKQYVDNVARGLQWKAPVRAATTANGALASAYANGQSIDGVTLATGDRVLIKNQTTAAENGIYTVNASGTPTRGLDADTNGELAPGTSVSVTEGTTGADKVFMIISDAAITIGTTSQTWGQLGAGGSSYTAGNGINIAGSVISAVAAASGGVSVAAGGIGLDNSIAVRKFSANIGNGALTAIPVVHNLGTQDVVVALREVATLAGVLVDWTATDANTVTLTFAVAPASNAYRVTVHA
jgi:hypothetical protein